MGEREIAKEIMKERLLDGIDVVKQICKEHNMPMTEPMFIKGLECGVSLFIQKETQRRFAK